MFALDIFFGGDLSRLTLAQLSRSSTTVLNYSGFILPVLVLHFDKRDGFDSRGGRDAEQDQRRSLLEQEEKQSLRCDERIH